MSNPHLNGSVAVTRGIRIMVVSRFIPERSSPSEGRWFFAYSVRILNDGDAAVRLVSRHWVITDGNGRTEEVRGQGVVGQQPRINAGGSFDYTSSCPLPTPFGVMEGTYQMVTEDGERFDARIAPFSLSEPYAIN